MKSLLRISLVSLTLLASFAVAQDFEVDDEFFENEISEEGAFADDPDFENNSPEEFRYEEHEEIGYDQEEDIYAEGVEETTFSQDSPEESKKKEPRPPRKISSEPGVKFIEHPHAKKGLLKIDKDRVYYYDVKRSPQTKASSVRFGFFSLDQLKNQETGTYFQDFYDEQESPMILFDYEWQIWQGALGKFGLKVGSGLHVSRGNGVFKNSESIPENKSKIPEESFNFVFFPNSLTAVYRMQFTDKQLIVPYIEGGLGLYTFGELREDSEFFALGSKGWRLGGAATGIGAAGLALNLSFVDKNSLLNLDREYGVNDVYFVGEFRYAAGFTNFDFTSSVINFGILAEF